MNPTAKKAITLFLALLLLVQLGFIAFVNLTRGDLLLDHDSGGLLRHAMAVAKEGSLWVRGWNTPSTMEWDTVLLPAGVLYALTGNIYLSAGIGNLLICALLFFAVVSLCRNLALPREGVLFTLILLFAPYAVGMLDYTNMLYFGGGQYAIKVSLVFLLFSLLLTPKERRGRALHIVAMALYFPLLFLSCASSGSYVFLCGVVPAFLAYGFISLREDRFDRYMLLILLASSLFAVGGNLLCQRLQASSTTAGMQLLDVSRLVPNIAACLTGLLELLGAIGTKGQNVFSLGGIAQLSRLCVLLLLVFCVFRAGARIKKDGSSPVLRLYTLCLCAFFVNVAILCLCDTTYGAQTFEYRYHLIGTLPLFLLPGALLYAQTPKRKLLRLVLPLGFAALLGLVTLTGMVNVLRVPSNTRQMNALYTQAKELRALHQADTIFMYTPIKDRADYQALSLAAFDEDIPVHRIFEDGSIDLFNQSFLRRDNGDFGETNLVILHDPSALSPHIAQSLEYLGGDGTYGIYLAPHNVFDGFSGVPAQGTNVDLPTSEGYSYYEEGAILHPDGSLSTAPQSGTTFWGPACAGKDGVYDITLTYDASAHDYDIAARFYLASGYNSVLHAEVDLRRDEGIATLQNVRLDSSLTGMELRLTTGGTPVHIKRIVYTRVGD